jgi:hypothetical protein
VLRADQRLGDRLPEVAGRVAHHVGAAVVDDPVRHADEVDVVRRPRADVEDVRARRHGVDGLDVECLLRIPALLVGA